MTEMVSGLSRHVLFHRRFWLTHYKASVNGRVFYEVAHHLDSYDYIKCSRRISISHCLASTAQMANHASTRTTQLYDRRRDKMSLDEVEKVIIGARPKGHWGKISKLLYFRKPSF